MLPLPRRLRLSRGVRDDEIAHLFEDPLEVRFFDREAVEVRRGIQPVDRVQLPVADRELDRVPVVAQRARKSDRPEYGAWAEVGFYRPAEHGSLVERRGGVVPDRQEILPSDGD